MFGALIAPALVVALLPGLSTKPAARQQAQSPAAQCPTLITSYDACCDLLLSEIQASQAGDEITLGIYLLEGGSSSSRVRLRSRGWQAARRPCEFWAGCRMCR